MIVALCGPPATGKTTLATRLRDRLTEDGRAVRLLHSDDFSRNTYDRLAERVATDPAADWLVDGTFYRREWQERFRTLGDVRFVRVRADLETCLARNRDRADAIDEQGVHVVYREFEPPDADLVVDTDELPVADAVDRVATAVETW